MQYLLEFYNFEPWRINQDIQDGRINFYKNLYRTGRQKEMDIVPYETTIESEDIEFIKMRNAKTFCLKVCRFVAKPLMF